jgi:arylsulfatase
LVALLCSLTVPLGRAQERNTPPEGNQPATVATATPRLQVVLILADDLGPGELGCYGQERLATPNIDRLAAAGMRFTQAYSASPVCAPSRCALLTGLHSGHARIRDNRELGGFNPGDAEGQWPLPAGGATLPVLLQAAGYRCGIFGKWGLGGPASSGQPLNQGFGEFFGYLCQRVAHNHYPTHLWSGLERFPLAGNPVLAAHQRLEQPLGDEAQYQARFAGETYAPDAIQRVALGFLAQPSAAPKFLYYPCNLPHLALQVPARDWSRHPADWDARPYLGQGGYLPHPRPHAAYAAMVGNLDRYVGEIWEQLAAAGQLEHTLLLFTSDNGPASNGGADLEFFGSLKGQRGHKGSLWEGGIRVPLLAVWPGHIAPGSSSDALVGLQDLLPTILDCAGVELPAGLDGISLRPLLEGRPAEQVQHSHLYWEYAGAQALRVDRWKALRPRLGQGDQRIELYDLVADPAESRDLAAERAELLPFFAALFETARRPEPDFPLRGLDVPGRPR